MARLRLRERETRAKYLPEVCMVCGEPSESIIRRTFSWFPPWVGLTILLSFVPYIILVIVLTKKMTVDVPICGRHGGYFWKRTAFIWLVLLGWLVISGALFAVGVVVAENNRGNASAAPMIGCLAFIVGLIVAIIVIAVVQNTTIRPKEITDHEITLVAVHDRFMDAMDGQRESRRGELRRDEEDDYEPPPRRRRRDEDDDPRQRDRFRDRPDDDAPRRRRDDF